MRVCSAHQICLTKHLKGVEQAEHRRHEQRGQQPGQRDTPKALPCPRTVHAGGLIQAVGDTVQPRHPQIHVIARGFTHIGADEHPDSRVGAHKIHRLRAQRRQNGVDEPLPVEQRLPQQHDAGHRDSHGDQIGCFKNTAAVLCGAHGHGQQQADAQQQGHTHADEARSIARRQAERAVAQHRGVVRKPHEAAAHGVGKAAAHRVRKRHQHEHAQPRQAGREEQIRRGAVHFVRRNRAAWRRPLPPQPVPARPRRCIVLLLRHIFFPLIDHSDNSEP